MELEKRSETETSLNEVTKTLTKNKNPKRVAAGKKFAEFNKKEKESLKQKAVVAERVERHCRNARKRSRDERALQGLGSSGLGRFRILHLRQLARYARFTFERNAR